jgi:hypothetical protein
VDLKYIYQESYEESLGLLRVVRPGRNGKETLQGTQV